MALTTDIVATYRNPAAALRRRAVGPPREDRALVTLMLACGLYYIAQWPRIAREAHADESLTLQALLGGALLGWIFVAPLLFYLIAALSHLVARLFGGKARWYDARMALFWALLATTPLALLQGLTAGFVGPGPAETLVAVVSFGTFLVFWFLGLRLAESGEFADAA
ncbi:Yip1 domain-containing protein [Tranquillimonas rosea]|uniref:Yip1 domain-containing protein n=1 Tax=Tranquillimonas rosea TaxID=641238 RepID=A0A1H9VHN8_9RHOB|nr:YIP1 family protein [Tranquillimonas rosea]SES21215.1 Yip1 domain-containing protein [Tranquillimonas rosea]